MEENKNLELESIQENEEKSSFDFATIYTVLILNWKWFVLSLIICMGAAHIYLRYATPIYQSAAKLLIKDDEGSGSRRGGNSIQSATNLGIISNSNGIDNEMEILKSRTLAQQAVYDLKLYVNYRHEGKLKDHVLYGDQEVNIDMDLEHLKKLNAPMNFKITREGRNYHVTGSYYVPIDNNSFNPEAVNIDKTFSALPATIGTRVGIVKFTLNGNYMLRDGESLKATMIAPEIAAGKYVGSLNVAQASKTTTIVDLVLNDEIPQRAIDYLKQLAIVYNRQANEDKNEIAVRTEQFINQRLEKINTELGNTEGQLENYKKRNNMVELKMNASQAVANADQYAQKLNEANTQVALLDELTKYMNEPSNRHQPIPSNVGLSDASATSLINEYNRIALQRNQLLHSASENSPTVTPLTAQLDDLNSSIKRAMTQARAGLKIQRNSIAAQAGKYEGQINNTPEQERMLTQIGRQQEVKSGLYLMLLQKREENSISLAATADKGKLIDNPVFAGKVTPKNSMIMLIALILGLAIPAGILFLLEFFRYKIEGHNDVAKLTNLPIIADVAIASERAKTKADIVVHENKNNLMEEIFRSLRTNLQFLLKQHDKVIMFTSTISGEGKTFIASNVAISFALLGKKVVLVGLDIRKPRLAELFEIDNYNHGITNLLVKDEVNWNNVKEQITPSGINDNLDILMAGPVPPNPGELVTRESLEQTIEHLKEHYDYILLDTAPVGLVTDTLALGRISNATVYVCRADFTQKASFGLINSLSMEKKLPNMSIVLNGVDLSKKKYGYYYGYGKYGKYGKYGNYAMYGSKGKYGYKSYGYGSYGSYYGSYGNYSKSHYGDINDDSVKK
ncbi:polysaccharide biosynthesis tyrosine autokinase [Prevotella hominis]|uniref:GumC family protein n=1 Tax=Segatella hominis TaxID=2518605 RepID=UPI001F24A37F|nr:polysaccharide biosynthesis tyrosine autokinase [Segatella hominis]MCF2589942.1 polysaccharide biosynthesis tyrosine autokinase [Segatella hominis]